MMSWCQYYTSVKAINVNIDIAPTMIEMSGQTIDPEHFDGISLLPFVMEDKEKYLNTGDNLKMHY